MHWPKLLIVLLIASIDVQAQVSSGLDTAIEGRINRILAEKEKRDVSNNIGELFDLKRKTDKVLSKFDFLNAVIADSYYGGGKSNESLKNDLLGPSAKASDYLKAIIADKPTTNFREFDYDLKIIDSLLESFYQYQVKNRYKNTVIKGDDDDNMLVEVEVKVLESYAGRKELPGFEVSCESPFVKNYREDFGVTIGTKRKISPGYRRFWIKQGGVSQCKVVRVVFGDPNTYLVTFSKAKSEPK